MKAHFGRKALWLGASLAALLSAPAAWAQETPDTVDEVIISAQRRDQDKQDVPVTVTVLGGDLIEEARIQSVQDVVAHTPGLQFDAYPASEPRLSVRGVSSSDRGASGDPSSAVFIDEIYYGRPAAISFETFDLQRIEVLKGPQGTLFGRNVVGGAVNIVTNRPGLTDFAAGAEASVGNFNSRDLAGYLNVPFADGKAAVRVGAALHQHDGYTDRIVGGVKEGELDDRDSRSGRIQLRLEPMDSLRINLGADYVQDRNKGPANHAVADDGSGGLSGLYTLNNDRDFNNATFDGYQDRDTWGVRAKVEYDLSFATLSYLGSFRTLDYGAYYDFDGSETPFGVGGIEGGVDEDTDFASNELQLKSLPDSHITWVVGLYQYRADTTRAAASYLDVGIALDDIIVQDSKTVSSAVYGDVTWPVTDRLNIFGGARYTRDEKDFRGSGQSNNPGTFFTNTNYTNARASDSWGAATWRLGLDYHVTPDVMLYGSVSRGFKSGGYQETPGDAAEAVTPFDPEYIVNYEAGLRSQFFDGRLTLNASVYLSDYTDLQVRVPSGTGFVTSNAGKARIQGLETEFSFDMGGGLGLSGSYAFTNAEFEDYQTIENGVPVDYSGNRLTRIPESKFSVSPSYTADLGGAGELSLAVDYVYESRIYDDASNLPPEIRDPTTFVDARAVYSDPSGRWSVAVWGKNLTDEQTRTFNATFAGVTFGAFNPPTTYGVTLRYDF